MSKKSKKKAADSTPQSGVYPDSRRGDTGAPVADDFHVKQARDWGDHNKK